MSPKARKGSGKRSQQKVMSKMMGKLHTDRPSTLKMTNAMKQAGLGGRPKKK